MNRAHSLMPRLLLASAFMLSALGAAPALSEPAPASRALPDPLHPCTVLLCLPKTGAAVQSTTSAQSAAQPAAQPAACAAASVQPVSVASDPEEGGQIARTAKPKPGEITVTKSTDKASTTLMERSAPPGSCP